MKEIGMFQAKTKFSEIARKVKSTGRAVRVTNRGEPVVDITPVRAEGGVRRERHEVFAELMEFRKELTKASLEDIRRDIAEGRH